MLILTDTIGRRVVDVEGTKIGRLVELTIRVDDPQARICHLGVGGHSRVESWWNWADVVTFESSEIRLNRAFDPVGSTVNLEESELWLARDVLDAQVFNSVGGRLVRVGDVDLLRDDEGLRAVAVQFGIGSVVARLGFPRLAERMRTEFVSWDDIQLATGRGLGVQLATRTHQLERLSASQLAALLAAVPASRATQILQYVEPDRAAGALAKTHAEVRSRVVGAMESHAASHVVSEFETDVAANTLRSISPDQANAVLSELASTRATELRRLIQVPAHVATSVMATAAVTVASNSTPAEIERIVREHHWTPTSIPVLVVVDGDQHPIAVIEPASLVDGSFDRRTVPVVHSNTGLRETVNLFALHDVLALPVVDDSQRLVGVVHIDDVFEELVAERLPGRARFRYYAGRGRLRRRVRASATVRRNQRARHKSTDTS